jgi:hypothetical protein
MNPERFRFIVVLYRHFSEVVETKEYIADMFPHVPRVTIEAGVKDFRDVAPCLYCDGGCFCFVDDFTEALRNRGFSDGLNLHRDKLAKYPLNLIVFAPEEKRAELLRLASSVIPDFWDFRVAVLRSE